VRVEASKKRLTITFPRSAGTFFTLRVETSRKPSATSRIVRNLLPAEFFEAEQVFSPPLEPPTCVVFRGYHGARAQLLRTTSTPSTSPSSDSLTSTWSLCSVAISFPTTSARIGSSRCPDR
jgi:hypothetical protein